MPPFDGTPPTIPPTKRPKTVVIPTACPIEPGGRGERASPETASQPTDAGADLSPGEATAPTGPLPSFTVVAEVGSEAEPTHEARTGAVTSAPVPALAEPVEAPLPLAVPVSAPAPNVAATPIGRREGAGSQSRLRRILRIGALTALGLVGAWVLLVIAQISAYRWIDPPGSMLMLARTLTSEPYDRRWVPLSAVSENLVRAVVVSEDAKFCSHRGVDWAELAAAIEEAEYGGTRGASTLSMQVAKNLFLWSDRSRLRKALELPLALALDAAWPKERVLEIYLNIAEWGPRIFGVEAAARHHFRKPARALSVREAALLATTLPSPLLRDPRRPDRRHARVAEIVRARMTAGRGAVGCLAGKAAPGRS